MNWLESRIPPPLVMLGAGALMWGLARTAGTLPVPMVLRLFLAAILVTAGIAFAVAGVRAFRAARTTINPLDPAQATALVTGGVYALTRNPMYVGMLLVLVGWAVYLASIPALLGPLAFVLYIGRFQIAPEERALAGLFGTRFDDYRGRSRRWLW